MGGSQPRAWAACDATPRPDAPIPEGPDGVTAEWLGAALQGSELLPPDAAVCALLTPGGEPLSGSAPHSGSWLRRFRFRRRLGSGAEDEQSAVVKCMRLPEAIADSPMVPDAWIFRLALHMHQYGHHTMCEREAMFFSGGMAEALARAQVRTPRVWYTAFDPGHKPGCCRYVCCGVKPRMASVIVFRDLSAYGAYEIFTHLPLDRALAGARTMGRLHAAWWGRAEDLPPDRSYSMYMYRTVWLDKARQRLDRGLVERFRRWLRRTGVDADAGVDARQISDLLAGILRNHEHIMRSARQISAPDTLLHGDFHGGNLLFPPDGDEEGGVCVIDWQLWGRGPAVMELVYFLCGSVALGDDHAVLGAYYDSLGQSALPFTQLETWVGFLTLDWVAATVVRRGMEEPKAEGKAPPEPGEAAARKDITLRRMDAHILRRGAKMWRCNGTDTYFPARESARP